MHYETLLLVCYEQQDYSALVRPEALSETDITALSTLFNATSHIARLKKDYPALYCFPMGEYALLVRHYDTGNRQAGTPSAVVEGAAVKLGNDVFTGAAAAKLVLAQASLLNISAAMSDTELRALHSSGEREIDATFENVLPVPFVTEFLERRAQERLFLPFTVEGRETLAAVLADSRFETPPYFAFGTNSEMLAQLEPLASIDIASFTKTERPSLRDRVTNQVTRYLDEGSGEPDYEAARTQRMQIYRKPQNNGDDANKYEDTRVGAQAMPIQNSRRYDDGADSTDEYDPDDTVLAMQQIPAGTRSNAAQEESPLRRVTRKLSSLLSPRKTE